MYLSRLRRLTMQIMKENFTLTNSQRNFSRKTVDAGIRKRKKILDADLDDFEELTDYDFDLEANFVGLEKSHKKYEEEMKFQKEREKYMIVARKYFKEKTPNFLTWYDKQQIRYLYHANPEEWTIEKLSEGFPALPHVITKIVKSNWTKNNKNKIESHDASVRENWKLFKEGKLNDLPLDLKKHLNNFTNRDLNLKSFEIPKNVKVDSNTSNTLTAPNIKIGTEYSDIIKSYKKPQHSNYVDDKNILRKSKIGKPPESDTYLLSNTNKNSKHITLDTLQNKIQEKMKRGTVPADEEIMAAAFSEEKNNISVVELSKEVADITSKRYVTNELTTNIKDNTKYNCLKYPEKIIIPKDKLKRGYTYKLNDCYYDDDGTFLYRVPGMNK